MTNKQLLETYLSENLDRVYRFAYTYMTNKEAAEDVVNDSVIKALQAIDSLRQPEHIGTWFHKIIANTALSQLARGKKIVYWDPQDFESLIDADEVYDTLSFEEMIHKLDPKYKVIIVQRFFEDMSLEDIAIILDENVNTVKTRLYKALKMLRIELEETL